MAVLGLKLNFTNFELPAFFVLIVLVWIVSQLFISILICYMLNLSIVWVPIANMANLGGISTAPAVTSAYKKELMPHAIVLAILSMITGTFWGIISTFLIKLFFTEIMLTTLNVFFTALLSFFNFIRQLLINLL